MIIKKISEYKQHGCNFTGCLALIDYEPDRQKDNKAGVYGAHTFSDYANKAKEMILKEYPNANILLMIPDLVAHI